MHPLVAHCHLGLGRLYVSAGDMSTAARHVHTAAATYATLDMPFWLEQAESTIHPPRSPA
jgi:hypothetical protein